MPAARLAAEAALEVIGRRENHEGTVKVEVFRSKVCLAGRSGAVLESGVRTWRVSHCRLKLSACGLEAAGKR